MTWGNKLLVVFVAFAALIGTLVYKCMNQNFELVSKDYYNDELRYQDKINGINNANKLSNVQIAQTDKDISIQLPKELNGLAVKGEAWFYCATNSLNDRKIPVQVNEEGIMKVEKNKLTKTLYQVKLNWQNGNENFYNEQNLQVK